MVRPHERPGGESKAPREHRVSRIRGRAKSDRELALALSIGGGVLALLLFLLVVMSSKSGDEKPAPKPKSDRIVYSQAKRPAVPEAGSGEELTREEALGIEREPSDEVTRKLTAREIMEGAYKAAETRAAKYAEAGEWGKAVDAMRKVGDAYDDMQTIMRCQEAIDGLQQRAAKAFEAVRAEAEALAQQGKHDEARAKLQDVVETFGLEQYVEKARTRATELEEQKWTEAEKDYRTRMKPIEELLPGWEFDEALAAVERLAFRYEKYQKLHAERVARIRGLIALRKRMIETVNRAPKRIEKRAVHAPGMPGMLFWADAEGIKCRTDRGDEKIAWVKLGPEATLRLALMAGAENDAKHRLEVARLLIEVGCFERAKKQLELAQRLGAQTAEDEEILRVRTAAAEQ